MCLCSFKTFIVTLFYTVCSGYESMPAWKQIDEFVKNFNLGEGKLCLMGGGKLIHNGCFGESYSF